MNQLIITLLAVIAFALLTFAMATTPFTLTGTTFAPQYSRLARGAGAVLLTTSVCYAIGTLELGVGLVNWSAALMLAGVGVAFTLPYFERKKEASKKDTGSRRVPKQAQRQLRQPVTATTLSATLSTKPITSAKAICGIGVLALPLTLFAWQLTGQPKAPLMRDDAISVTVDRWHFQIAQQKQALPDIAANGQASKTFIIKMCSRCSAEIKTAYLSIGATDQQPRQARNLRGRGELKTATLMIPKSDQLETQLWLNIESKQGNKQRVALDLKTLSPQLFSYITDAKVAAR